jgi:DNA polymerase-3 subunit alpha
MTFVHLHVHTEFSIRDSLVRIPSLIERLASEKAEAVALTDWMNLFAVIKFYKKATQSQVKPIIGADVQIQLGSDRGQCVLLCMNNKGYQQLTELISQAYTNRQGNDVCLAWSELIKKNSDLIALLTPGSTLAQAIDAERRDHTNIILRTWSEAFPDRLYLALERVGRANEVYRNETLMDLAEEHDLPVVAINSVCFLNASDFDAHETRVCIHQGKVLADPNRPKLYKPQQYLRTQTEMEALFKDCPSAIENSVEIAKRCTVKIELGKVFLPTFAVPEGRTLGQELEHLSQVGLIERVGSKKSRETAYQERLKKEVSVIDEMGFSGYFLIVADFIRWAKDQKIPVGPGRGSGAGSLVAYVLGITELDPLEFELLFERFLNPERVSMPDFDIDFCMTNRDRVIDYVANRYGHDSVSQIITYGTMAAKAVTRDVGRVMGFPYGFVDKIAKLIPFELGITLDKALQQEPILKERYDSEDDVRTLIDMAKNLEGLTRNAGRHAGGVVIAPTRLTDFTPLYCEADSEGLVSQFDKDDVEAVGLVKFDFLGLRTLTIIDETITLIQKNPANQSKERIDINKIPLNCQKTFQLLRRCETSAVFQLESRGMKDLIYRLQPDRFEDLIALVALFRPGPLQSGMVDDFIDRKQGRQKVEYFHPELKPILDDTYGVILYQEQVMKIAQVLASYSLGAADLLRRAMGKKKAEEMALQRQIFLAGAASRSIDSRTASEIFDIMEKFAGYGFNKSHSAAYALIAYQTAWLKAHYPAEFMAAVLSSDMDNTDKVFAFYQEAKRMKLRVLPPCINRSGHHFSVNEEGHIVYGLGAIKGFGEAAILHLIEERETRGPFKDLFNFTRRLDLQKISRRVLEPLVYSGAMDCFGETRSTLLITMESAHKAAQQHQIDAVSGQNSLFDDEEVAIITESVVYQVQKEWDSLTVLRNEKSALGFYFSGHPTEMSEKELSHSLTAKCGQLTPQNSRVILAGVVASIRTVMTKQGKRMAIATLEDTSGSVDVTIFSELYSKAMDLLNSDSVLIISGQASLDSFSKSMKVVAESIHTLDQVRDARAKKLLIKASDAESVERLCEKLPLLLKPYLGGQCRVVMHYQTPDGHLVPIAFGDEWLVHPNSDLMRSLGTILDEDAYKLVYAASR